jgi:hypothetical protein
MTALAASTAVTDAELAARAEIERLKTLCCRAVGALQGVYEGTGLDMPCATRALIHALNRAWKNDEGEVSE